MAKIAEELVIQDLTTYAYPSTYDPDLLGLGPVMMKATGTGAEDNWAGPFPVARGRPVEQAGVGAGFPWAMRWSNTIDWIFLADVSTAAATRRIILYTYNRTNGELLYGGFVTATPPPGTNHTIRAFRMTYDIYSTGTVEVSGTTVTGTSTAWQTARFAVGGRIGFGSTDPTQITTWYDITAIGSDTGITIGSSAGTISAGTAFVIEELRAVMLTTASVATNGGVFVVKGLNYGLFNGAGLTVAAAVSTDNVRATYWLADAATETNTTGTGLALEDKTSNTVHYIWALNGTTSMSMYKYNLRGALTLSSGKDTTTLQLTTGALTVTGTAVQFNNGRLATTAHGPGSGQNCIYFVTSTRWYRSIPVSQIQNASVSWIADSRNEIPAGGAGTYGASAAMLCVEYSSILDTFMVQVNSTAAKPYFSKYYTDASPVTRSAFSNLGAPTQSSLVNTGLPPVITLSVFSAWIEGAVLYLVGNGTTSTTNFIFTLPMGADWEFTNLTGNRLIFPKISTPNCKEFYRVLTTGLELLGQMGNENLGIQTEPIRVSYRTNGIDDDSGTWTLLPSTGDLSTVNAASEIQFSIEFKILGHLSIPARVFSLALIYEDYSQDVHYQASVKHTNMNLKRFAWRFSTAFGTSVPDLLIRIYDATTNNLLIEDTTDSPIGTFERSTDDGITWSAWNNTDKGNETTYIRYTPSKLGGDLQVKAILMVA